MDSTIWHSTNSGGDSKPVVWKFEGNQVLVIAASSAVAIAMFRLMADMLGLTLSLSLALAVPLTTSWIVVRFVTGRPPSYLRDYLRWKWLQLIATNRPLIALPERSNS